MEADKETAANDDVVGGRRETDRGFARSWPRQFAGHMSALMPSPSLSFSLSS